LASTLGYGLALPAGLVVVTLIPSLFRVVSGDTPWFLPLSEPGGTMFWPRPAVLALCGGVVGAAQWLALRRHLPRARLAMALLWVFGAWMSLSVGLAVGALVRTGMLGFDWPVFARGLIGQATAGAVIGLLTGALLIVLLREAQRLARRA
jgi:hypothetical protein